MTLEWESAARDLSNGVSEKIQFPIYLLSLFGTWDIILYIMECFTSPPKNQRDMTSSKLNSLEIDIWKLILIPFPASPMAQSLSWFCVSQAKQREIRLFQIFKVFENTRFFLLATLMAWWILSRLLSWGRLSSNGFSWWWLLCFWLPWIMLPQSLHDEASEILHPCFSSLNYNWFIKYNRVSFGDSIDL